MAESTVQNMDKLRLDESKSSETPSMASQKPKKAKEKQPKPKPTQKPKSEDSSDSRDIYSQGFLGALHKPGGNAQINPKRMEQHLQATGGRVVTRFPPEPNGYLHIGHSKALVINFGYARYHNGICYLRFDDTNPEAEEERFLISIQDTIKWLGFKPHKVSYSSDYFDQLYDLAEELIRRDKAYVDHSTDAEINMQRGGENHAERSESKWRYRPIEESLTEFRAMRDGKYKPKEAVLRMKQDISNGNPQMWDLAAYRVLNAPHHRTGSKWRIYPTYDLTHCLVDSLENISHSLCTTEFRLSRESYEWLCNTLDLYCPAQREYGRLNVVGTILSKRKILRLVEEGVVRDWNDPRLYTLVALRRRGIPPGAILAFVEELGVTTSDTAIQLSRFDQTVRKYLENSVPRLMMIPDPIPVILENLPDDFVQMVTVPFNPKLPEMGSHQVPFTKKVYIDRSDFREQDSKDYFRLAPNKRVGLLKTEFPIVATSFSTDESGKVTEIRAHYENDVEYKKPKSYIQWVADSPAHHSPVRLKQVREFHNLFNSQNPAAAKDILADVNPNSETILDNALIETGLRDVQQDAPWPKVKVEEGRDDALAPESVRFQAMRVGYYCLDQESSNDNIILNRIVTLKEDVAKKS